MNPVPSENVVILMCDKEEEIDLSRIFMLDELEYRTLLSKPLKIEPEGLIDVRSNPFTFDMEEE